MASSLNDDLPSARPLRRLEDLVVPEAVLPGGKLYALLPSARKGGAGLQARAVWKASGSMPAIQARVVCAAPSGARHTQRPSARAGNQRACDCITSFEAQVDAWSTNEPMPFELAATDVGWLPGPVGGSSGRALPAFSGTRAGPTDPSLGRSTGARRIMQSVQFSAHFLQRAACACVSECQQQCNLCKRCEWLKRARAGCAHVLDAKRICRYT